MHRCLFPYTFERTVSRQRSTLDVFESTTYRPSGLLATDLAERVRVLRVNIIVLLKRERIIAREADAISRLTGSNDNLLYSELACSLDRVISQSYVSCEMCHCRELSFLQTNSSICKCLGL
jgi:hypothetical protein